MAILYAGLDVSDKKTHICLVDERGISFSATFVPDQKT